MPVRNNKNNKTTINQNISNTKIESFTTDDPSTTPTRNSQKKRTVMKKAITTHPSSSGRKFNEIEFKKQMENFKEWEMKKKSKNAKIERRKIENETKLFKNPKINTQSNLKLNTNPKNYTAVERLLYPRFNKKKRKKIALTKVYTPTFKPKLYTTKQNLGKIMHQIHNNRSKRKIKIIN